MSRCDLFPSAEALLADIRFYPYPMPAVTSAGHRAADRVAGAEAGSRWASSYDCPAPASAY